MSRRKVDATAETLFAALARLQVGQPTEAGNVAAHAKGRLRVNVASVAREAGFSRTLVGHEGCQYPDVRAAILAAMPMPDAPSGGTDELGETKAKLKEDRAILERHVRVLATRLNDASLQARELEDKVRDLKEKLAVATRDEGTRNNVVGMREKVRERSEGKA
ncbi:MAG: hypothetical protein INR68_11340 [Methylobacterium mesophilicum]|nr:hypothetical protein [Methylobacterium mesophilicum]